MRKTLLNVCQSAKYLQVTRQCIYFSIKRKLLNPTIINDQIFFSKDCLDSYKKNKYNRRFIRKLRIDQYTVSEASEMLGFKKSNVYYLMRSNRLNHSKIMGQYIIEKKDIIKYLKTYSTIS